MCVCYRDGTQVLREPWRGRRDGGVRRVGRRRGGSKIQALHAYTHDALPCILNVTLCNVTCVSVCLQQPVYKKLLPLYFPRSEEEERASLPFVPGDIGNSEGEPIIPERQIRITEKPGNQEGTRPDLFSPGSRSTASPEVAEQDLVLDLQLVQKVAEQDLVLDLQLVQRAPEKDLGSHV